ncbi:MAG: hypothetical protein ACYTBJ_01080 [Planctomycetota bacterium]|jgi:hypothetical protein
MYIKETERNKKALQLLIKERIFRRAGGGNVTCDREGIYSLGERSILVLNDRGCPHYTWAKGGIFSEEEIPELKELLVTIVSSFKEAKRTAVGPLGTGDDDLLPPWLT